MLLRDHASQRVGVLIQKICICIMKEPVEFKMLLATETSGGVPATMGHQVLIIVESPTKIRSLRKILGVQYRYASSVGHIRDLPQKGLGVDIESDFAPEYTVLQDKKKVVAQLKKEAKECSAVYLAPDPDREGEAIAWHLSQVLPEQIEKKRVVFHSLTKEAVLEAMEHPRNIDDSLVDAQQARRVLDRLVGYKVSPILIRRIGGKDRAISAGRVQSAALKLVVDRERDIQVFQSIEFWTLRSRLQGRSKQSFWATLVSVDGKKIEKVASARVTSISNEQRAKEVYDRLLHSKYTVTQCVRKDRKRAPFPPFITSTLQQEASRHFGFVPARTMQIAQSLYEGIEMEGGSVEGLITYMRTDSTRISEEGLRQARKYISDHWDSSYLPSKARRYVTQKSAQDAHEAIRPTRIGHSPEAVGRFLTSEQGSLYSLIWNRFLASQMTDAVYNLISYTIQTDRGDELRATGSALKFDGFLTLYEEKQDEEEGQEGELLPPVAEGEVLPCEKCDKKQRFTQPPPRFSEASLIKELEKSGIGRPSTYASIMQKINHRSYTKREKKRIVPTELGCVITSFLEEHFPTMMDLQFTRSMEDLLEEVARGTKPWKMMLREFWKDFAPLLSQAETQGYVSKQPTDHICPSCGKSLERVWARTKWFLGCSGYPECDFSISEAAFSFDKGMYSDEFDWDQPCPKCHKKMAVRHGQLGAFLGCSDYPACRGVVSIPKKGEKVHPCPIKGCKGVLVQKKSRYGKPFFSCSTFPDCRAIGNTVEAVHQKYEGKDRVAYSPPSKKETKEKTKKGASPKRGTVSAVKASTADIASQPKTEGKTKKTAAPKEEKKRKAPSASSLYQLSPLLSKVLSADCMGRSEVMKGVWDYIKSNNLQNPFDRRKIKGDALLVELFDGEKEINMLQLGTYIKNHLKKIS